MGKAAARTTQETVGYVASRSACAQSTTRPGSYLWPELRISRQALWERGENDGTDFFLKSAGSQNRRRGHARVLSELACTYVRDGEMRRMILEKYDGIGRDVRKAADVYRKIGRGINQFIRESSVLVREYEGYVKYGERFGRSGHLVLPDATTRLWQKAVFQIDGQDGYGRNQLGFSLRGNPELMGERQELVAYLRNEEKLNTAYIDRSWEPHAIFFDLRPELRLGSFAMRYQEATPRDILMQVPSACTDV